VDRLRQKKWEAVLFLLKQCGGSHWVYLRSSWWSQSN